MSRNFGAGSFGHGPSVYEQQQTEFDVDARRALDGLGPSKPQLTAEQVKQAFEEAQREDQRIVTNAASADEFLALHGEFRDTAENGKRMNETLRTMFGDGAWSLAQFEQAYAVLRPTGVLNLDKAEIARQEKQAKDEQRQAANKRRTDAEARVFNPQANYDNLSLEELRTRSDEALSLAGQQEGANGF